MTAMASRREVIEETNARYWVGTGYKLGEALDPRDPTDGMHARRWLDTYRDLLRQNARGALTLLHKDPSFAQSLTSAINAYRIERSTQAGDPRYAEAQRVKQQALSDAGLWQEMIMSRGTSAVSGYAHVGQTANQIAEWEQLLNQATDAEFLQATGRARVENDAMSVEWLALKYALLTRGVNKLRTWPPSEPVHFGPKGPYPRGPLGRWITDYQARLKRRFAANPSWDRHARKALQRIQS